MKTALLGLLVLGAAASVQALETPMPGGSPELSPAPENDYPHYRKFLENPPDGTADSRIADAFLSAIRLLSTMNEPQEFDRLLRIAETKYSTNLPLLTALYDSAHLIPSYGYRIGEEFIRGRNRGGYGMRFSCSERDRVLLLRLFDAAFRRNPDALPGSFYARFAGLWITGREGDSAWKLREKTDLTVLPEGFNGGVYFGPGCYIHLSYVTVIFAFLLASLVILRHLSNIKRLEKVEEPETHFKKD